ncbi:hypothetical protein OG806_15260 [Streptomyces sp. NBC_00882]|uniref:hypothetical protein n=1 Tax=Streptomyces sp. NBC_00882 TaxID=2975856 RepID=UPI0038635898|nr:hypothetical protein OG806_15260 [Streptomyces sp. NBC_00882]
MPPPPQPPYAWGVPPVILPPPKKSRVGLVIGIAGGVFVVVLAILLTLVTIGAKAESGFPEAEFALVLPRMLLDGRYELTKDLSDILGRRLEKDSTGIWDAKVTHGVVGRYSLGGDPTKGALLITGFYGRFKNADKTRANALKRDGEADGVTVAVPPRDVTPTGSAVKISCEVLIRKRPTLTITYPVCAWADGNTSALVAEMTFGAANADLDLKSAARTTLQVRSETVKAIS